MNIRPAEESAVLRVASNMREWDRREIYATRWIDDPASLARDCIMVGGLSWVAGEDQPIAAVGAFPICPGVWSVWMFATPRFRRIARPLTDFVTGSMVPALKAAGAHRAQCESMVGHDMAHGWLRRLGARQEGIQFGRGKGGEDFIMFAWER